MKSSFEVERRQFSEALKHVLAQIDETASKRWGDHWEEGSVDNDAKLMIVAILKQMNKADTQSLCGDLLKETSWYDPTYIAALRHLLTEPGSDDQSIKNVTVGKFDAVLEKVQLPDLWEVLQYARTLIEKYKVDVLSDQSLLHIKNDIVADHIETYTSPDSSDIAELAQQFLDEVNGLNRALQAGRSVEYLAQRPEFWMYFKHAEKLEKQKN